MKATTLLTLQLTAIITMLFTAESLFTSKAATVIFATSFIIFAKCSTYISRNSKRLLKEINKEKENSSVTSHYS